MNCRILTLLLMSVSLVTLPDCVLAEVGGRNVSVLRLQTKAEELYESGHFERAYFIYVNELAKSGDKYAQYMAGYMCLNGQGVRQDPVQASAWYRLAAEHGAPEFIEVRDDLLASMSAADRHRSDALYVALRQEFSDLTLALARVIEDRRELGRGVTGSRLSKGDIAGPVTIIDPQTGESITRAVYVARLEKRMQLRLDFITGRMGAAPVDADMSDREFEAFSDRVSAYLAVIDDR